MLRKLALVAVAAALTAACTTQQNLLAHQEAPPPITPTEQFAITVTQAPDEILLAPHAAGLSPAQAAALGSLVDRWREAGADAVTIRSPGGGSENVYRAVAAIEEALQQDGVPPDQIRTASYDPGDHANAPVAVGFIGYRAQGPQCGHNWEDYTKSGDNRVNNNFGCATTANIAAMIANPGDLLRPQPMGPADAGRREVELGNYRKGAITSSAKDPQANGAVSNAMQQ